ncbi:GAF domain-containing protein [uncultured Rubinisphaera sp.]|uniref:GAF domain-containing protein n=1 Tax=uncultured Rubinisphaera sp. TaxID=1678686 RepID=UPI0030D9A294
MSNVRVAVVQLTCHPSFTIGGRDYSSEPFLEGAEPILNRLARSMDVTPIRELCREEYRKFHDLRLASALQWIADKWDLFNESSAINSTQIERQVSPLPLHLIAFPEGSVRPEQVAKFIVPFVKKAQDVGNYVTVLAGTHAFPACDESFDMYPDVINYQSENPFLDLQEMNRSEAAVTVEPTPLTEQENIWRRRKKELHRLKTDGGYDAKSVMPIVHYDASVSMRLKEMPSPFERTNTAQRGRAKFTPDEKERRRPQVFYSLDLPTDNRNAMDPNAQRCADVPILPLVCSEALQLPDAIESCKIVVVLAYHKKHQDFMALAQQARLNGKLVVLANDGAFGGSGVFLTPDDRAENWWFGEPKNGQLPPGDGILLVDVDLNHIAPQLGQHNPHYPNGIVGLAALVSGNSRSLESKVADVTSQIHTSIESSFQTSIDDVADKESKLTLICNEHLSRIRAMINSPKIGEIQQSKLWRIRELLQLHNLTRERASIWCEDAKIQRHRDSIGFLNSNVNYETPLGEELSLAELESRLAWETLQFLEHETSIANEKGMLHDASDLVAVKRLLESRLGRNSATSPLVNVMRALTKNRDDSVSTAQSRLSRRLGRLVEKFSGTSGWLFLVRSQVEIGSPKATQLSPPTAKPRFYPIVAYNAPELSIDREVQESGSGIIGRVAYSKKPYLANDVTSEEHKKLYLADVPSTRSELTVPLLHSGRVLGVLNIEANYRNAFGLFDVNTAMSEATRLVSDLLVIEASESEEEITQWHHVSNGWLLTPYFDSLCNAIATALPTLHGSPSIGCSVWALDVAKECVSILGTARFDFEYVAERTLGAATSHIGNAILAMLKEHSEKGESRFIRTPIASTIEAAEMAGHLHSVSWYEECRLISDLPGFKRKRKARRMELRTITVFPFLVDSIGTEPVPCALVLHGFEHEWGARGVSLTQMFSPTVGHNLVAEMSSAISNFFRQKTQIASAYLLGRLQTDPTASRNPMETIKQVFQRVFAAHGSTVFVKLPQKLPVPNSSSKGHLSLVATTGITPVGPNASSDWRSYPLYELDKNTHSMKCAPRSDRKMSSTKEDDAETINYHVGLTNYLGIMAGAVIRKADAVDIEEPLFPLTETEKPIFLAPRNSLLESFAPGASEHMRFLGASVTDGKGEVVGAIRLTRTGIAPPFNMFDEFVIREMCRKAASVFVDKRDQMQIPFNDWPVTSTVGNDSSIEFHALGAAISQTYGNAYHDSLGASLMNVANFLNTVVGENGSLASQVHSVFRELMPLLNNETHTKKSPKPRASLKQVQDLLGKLNDIISNWGKAASLAKSAELHRRLLVHSLVELRNSLAVSSILEDLNALCRDATSDASRPDDNPTVLSSMRYVQSCYSEDGIETSPESLRVLAVQPAWSSEKPDEEFRDAISRPRDRQAIGWHVTVGKNNDKNPQPLSYSILSPIISGATFHRMHPHSLSVKSGICFPFSVLHPYSNVDCPDFQSKSIQCILSVDFALPDGALPTDLIGNVLLPAMELTTQKLSAVLSQAPSEWSEYAKAANDKMQHGDQSACVVQAADRYNKWSELRFEIDGERDESLAPGMALQFWKQSREDV